MYPDLEYAKRLAERASQDDLGGLDTDDLIRIASTVLPAVLADLALAEAVIEASICRNMEDGHECHSHPYNVCWHCKYDAALNAYQQR